MEPHQINKTVEHKGQGRIEAVEEVKVKDGAEAILVEVNKTPVPRNDRVTFSD